MFSSLLSYDHNTVVLYLMIVFFATVFATFSQSKIRIDGKSGKIYRENRYGWFILSFLTLVFFACSTGVGTDRESYKYFFRISEFGNLYEYFEPGFRLLIGVVKLFTDNEQFFLILVSFLTVAFTYKGIWDCRNEIHVGLAVFIYSSQYYLQGYNIMRMYFAMSILLVGVKWIKEKKYYRYLLLIIIATCFHYGVLFVAIAYMLALWFMKTKRIKFDIKFYTLLFLAILFGLFAVRLVEVVIRFSSVLSDKYLMYIENITENSIGFKAFFNLIPFVLGMIFAKYSSQKNEMQSIFGAYLLITLIISLMSYSVIMLGRVLICLHMPCVILLPVCVEAFQRNRKLNGNSKIQILIGKSRIAIFYKFVIWFIIAYFIVAFLLYLSEYIGLDGINNFRFFWTKK